MSMNRKFAKLKALLPLRGGYLPSGQRRLRLIANRPEFSSPKTIV
jgi:hypothetical protein